MGGRVRGMMVGALVLVCGSAWAQEGVLFCSEDQSTGFRAEGSSYKRAGFEGERFKVRIEGAVATVADPMVGTIRYQCKAMTPNQQRIACTDGDGYMFNLDRKTGRFVLAKGFGYVFSKEDTVTIGMGTCAAF